MACLGYQFFNVATNTNLMRSLVLIQMPSRLESEDVVPLLVLQIYLAFD